MRRFYQPLTGMIKLIVISLIGLTTLEIQYPAMALVNKEKSWNFQPTLPWINMQNQTIQIAKNDQYWGPQRDFEIWMPGDLIENTKDHLMATNTTTNTTYMIMHGDIPTDTYYLNSQEIREILQTSLRSTIGSDGKVVKSTNIEIKGYPGLELLIQHSDGTQGQYQGYIVRRRLYLLAARTSDELTTEVANFFDSFRIYPSRIVSYN
jgi:hypothetical protein